MLFMLLVTLYDAPPHAGQSALDVSVVVGPQAVHHLAQRPALILYRRATTDAMYSSSRARIRSVESP